MNKHTVLSTLKKRIRQFKKLGYDLPASRLLLWKLSGIRSGKVLEIGTGKGHLTALLAKKGLRLVSIDLDPGPLRIAKLHLKALKLGKCVTLQKMNAEKLSYPARSFDHVVSMDFFHHAKNPIRCLLEMMRVTRKMLVIADLNKKGMKVMDRVHRSEGKKHEISRIPFQDLKKYLAKNGFSVKSYRRTCHQIFKAQRRPS